MTRTIRVTSSGAIKRPLDEVRQQFADMAYHAAANVHEGVRFTILSQDAQQCRYRQEVTLLGMRQTDDLLNTWQPDGSLTSAALAGTNEGLRVLYRFAGSAKATVVWVTFEIPARGLKRLIAPLFRWVAQRALRKAFEEDRRDLESGAYARFRSEAPDSAPSSSFTFENYGTRQPSSRTFTCMSPDPKAVRPAEQTEDRASEMSRQSPKGL